MLILVIDLVTGVLLLSIAVIDARRFEIPDRLSFSVIGLALLRLILVDGENVIDPLLGGLVSFVLFESTRRIMATRLKRDALGMGDVKLMIGGGIWVGLSHIPAAILIACFGGLIHFGILALFGTKPVSDQKIPFGPYLVAGLLIVQLPFIPDMDSLLVPF